MAALLIGFAPTASADPQCWSRYDQAHNENCGARGGGPFTVGPAPGQGGDDGLLGVLHRLTGGIL